MSGNNYITMLLDLHGRRTTLQYRCRRYLCLECGKKFAEKCTFAGRYQRFTHRVTAKTIDLLRLRSRLKAVSEDVGISLSGVNRVLNALAAPKPNALPEAISFDEFKGNLGGERFQCIVTDPLNCRVLDILPKRTVESIQDYLRSSPYREKVHVVRFCTQAMDDVRKSVQKQLAASRSAPLLQALSSAAAQVPRRTG